MELTEIDAKVAGGPGMRFPELDGLGKRSHNANSQCAAAPHLVLILHSA